ncbi:MAG: helix-turn-helix domain-containing protein [Thermoplasmata archaeon]|nr:helix-turn-helix domain-containing protein [Thermoplasmata archaeon]
MERELMEKIAGEMVVSHNFGATMRKWREKFAVHQKELAQEMGVSPSVISDYEAGRRRSPGVATVRRIVESLIELDKKRGSPVLKEYMLGESSDVVLGMSEFPRSVSVYEFLEIMEGEVVNTEGRERDLYGYTIIDSLRAILRLGSYDYLRIYGWSTERALVFTDVEYGRSPMIAVRAHPLKPGMVVYLRPKKVDPLAIKLADVEAIPLVTSPLSTHEAVERLAAFTGKMEKEEGRL